MSDLQTRLAEYEQWVAEVRDPAHAADIETETITYDGNTATYQLAHIPTGWAWRCEYHMRDGACGVRPWEGYCASRDRARDDAINGLLRALRCTPAVDRDDNLTTLIEKVMAHRDQGALW